MKLLFPSSLGTQPATPQEKERSNEEKPAVHGGLLMDFSRADAKRSKKIRTPLCCARMIRRIIPQNGATIVDLV